jgi:hypothetical protein
MLFRHSGPSLTGADLLSALRESRKPSRFLLRRMDLSLLVVSIAECIAIVVRISRLCGIHESALVTGPLQILRRPQAYSRGDTADTSWYPDSVSAIRETRRRCFGSTVDRVSIFARAFAVSSALAAWLTPNIDCTRSTSSDDTNASLTVTGERDPESNAGQTNCDARDP